MTEDHVQYQDSVGAYLLGALTDAERREFEAHLAGCGRCRADVSRLRIAAESLPASAPPMTPPPELKDRIMTVVRSEAELLRAAGPAADQPPPLAQDARRRGERRPLFGLRPALALGAACALLLVGGLAGVALDGDGGEDARTLAGRVASPGGSAAMELRDGAATLRVRGMRNPPRGRVYQVWLKRPGESPEATNALFEVRSDGTASVAIPGDMDGVESVLVTSEPPGGSSVPSTPPIVTVRT